jgi:hypothetical protein
MPARMCRSVFTSRRSKVYATAIDDRAGPPRGLLGRLGASLVVGLAVNLLCTRLLTSLKVPKRTYRPKVDDRLLPDAQMTNYTKLAPPRQTTTPGPQAARYRMHVARANAAADRPLTQPTSWGVRRGFLGVYSTSSVHENGDRMYRLQNGTPCTSGDERQLH